jgi:hypothetical protein
MNNLSARQLSNVRRLLKEAAKLVDQAALEIGIASPMLGRLRAIFKLIEAEIEEIYNYNPTGDRVCPIC